MMNPVDNSAENMMAFRRLNLKKNQSIVKNGKMRVVGLINADSAMKIPAKNGVKPLSLTLRISRVETISRKMKSVSVEIKAELSMRAK